MIGIYKITNELTGKSYVGQSIHCGKRLDEHCKGSQFIDEIIQVEGIENFSFQVLKQVEKESLSYWEDYFILKFDTMFPNGYNRRFNSDTNTVLKIKEDLMNELNSVGLNSNTQSKKEKLISNSFTLTSNNIIESEISKDEEKDYTAEEICSLPNKILKYYLYLYYNSYYDGTERFWLKRDFNYTEISRQTNISPKTLKKYQTILKSHVIETESRIYIKNIEILTKYFDKDMVNELDYTEIYMFWRINYYKSLGISKLFIKEISHSSQADPEIRLRLVEKNYIKIIPSSDNRLISPDYYEVLRFPNNEQA